MSPFGPFGGITLDGVQFNTDPATYEPLNWEKRFSVHQAIGGKVTIQDFGTFLKDDLLRLASGPNNPIDEPTMLALHSRFRTKGVTFTFTDWLANTFSVFIERFVAVPLKKGLNIRDGGTISLYTYEMQLHVLSITNFFGTPFTGS